MPRLAASWWICLFIATGLLIAEESEREAEDDPTLHEEITVSAASRRPVPWIELPAASGMVDSEEIELRAAPGLPSRMLDNLPGAEIAQSGIDWYLVNTRGFGSGFNRRVTVMLDGRDISIPFSRIPEWGGVILPTDDLASMELVRGPGSALYGADAFNGVIDMRTRSPRESLGGSARLTVGEHGTLRADLRHSMELAEGWYLKVTGTAFQNDTYSVSRFRDVEYSKPCPPEGGSNCLPLDAVERGFDSSKGRGVRVRIDRDVDEGLRALFEVGASGFNSAAAYFSSLGRFQTPDEERTYVRARLERERWSLQAIHDDRAAETLVLASELVSYLDESRSSAEASYWTPLPGGEGHLLGGLSYREERIDSANPEGVQTLLPEPAKTDFIGVFAEIDYPFSERLTGYGSLRWDDGTLYDPQLSVRVSAVYEIGKASSLRVGYANAFIAPTPGERSLRIPLLAPIDLSPFEAFCTAEGVECGFGTPLPILGVGNPALDVETSETWELGWRARLGGGWSANLELYYSTLEDFFTEPLPVNDLTLGSFHPGYGPYAPPDELSAGSRAALVGALAASLPPEFFAALTNERADQPIFALSYANFGRVRTAGAELALAWQPVDAWLLRATYTFFDDDIDQELESSPLAPNASRHRFTIGGLYRAGRLEVGLDWRHVQGFAWRSGLFVGPVPTHDVVNARATYEVRGGWGVGVDVENLFDSDHYEQFGANLLRRRALVSVRRSW